MPATPRIAVVVPSHRAEDTIGRCLDGLLRQTLGPGEFEIHVVDTGADATADVVAQRAMEWNGRLVYHHADGRGPGRQRNLGVDRASARFLAFIDADCVAEPGWLEAGIPHLERGASIVQGPTLTPDGSPPPPFAHAIATNGPSPLYESCNIMYSARAFREAGGFPVDLFDRTGSHMGEDTELAWQVRREGGEAVYEPRAVVRHLVLPADYSRYLRYQWQSRFFPRLVKRVPELRRELLEAEVFLGRRSMRTAAALAGLALGSRSRWAHALTLPLVIHLARMGARARSPRAAGIGIAKRLVADVVREIALVWGSIRYRSIVL
jgi:glycosyltransferase involved in cell wall biosynthesis